MTTDTITLTLYRVPKGATIPKGTPFYRNPAISANGGTAFGDEYTLTPIPAPPALPTEAGSVILNATTEDGEEHPMMVLSEEPDGLYWYSPVHDWYYREEHLTSWTPATVIPTDEHDRLKSIFAASTPPRPPMSEFTERQAAAWPEAVAEVQRYVYTSTVSPHLTDWTVEWAEETRPGRGHAFSGIWCDGEYMAQVLMDVYGYPAVSVAEVSWVHSSSDEECDCGPCAAERETSDE